MLSGKCRPSCPGLNVLMPADWANVMRLMLAGSLPDGLIDKGLLTSGIPSMGLSCKEVRKQGQKIIYLWMSYSIMKFENSD